MYDIPEDCLLTYDPDYLDLHSNSTDFEDSHILRVAPKSGNHSLFNKKKLLKLSSKDRTSENALYNSEMSKSSSKVLYETETIYNDTEKESQLYKSYNNRKTQMIQQIEAKNSKRHKIIPSISSIFKKSSNHCTPRTALKESRVENSSQTYHAIYDPRAVKSRRRQQHYAVQPVYGIERNIYAQTIPYKRLKKNREPLPAQITSRDQYFNTVYSLTSSSEVDHQLRHVIETKRKWTKQVDSNVQKDFKDGNFLRPSHKDQQQLTNLIKRRRKFPFQVYANPRQYTTVLMPNSDVSSTTSAVPSTCSGFWDYLFNKINSKYQKVQVYKTCKCCATERVIKTSPCCNAACNAARDPSTDPLRPLTNTCSCNAPVSENQEPSDPPQTASTPAPSAKFSIAPKSQRHNTSSGDVNESSQKTEISERYDQTPQCQMGHNDLTAALNQKYNGEILCIHNPPCIVINGCLNLPPIGDNQTRSTPMWPVSDSSKPSYQKIYRGKRSKKKIKNNQEDVFDKNLGNGAVERSSQYHNHEVKNQVDKSIKMERNSIDQSCQYLSQTVDQYQLTELSTEEKNIQSYCNHAPPCQVKRKCHKPKYGPILNSNCFHVPMCENIPVCLLDSNDAIEIKTTCRHRPKCVEVPKCSIDYFVLNAKGETGTQVRLKAKLVCRHAHPCIMIPKCLAQMCAEGYTPHDAIPSCVHRPRCEMIPACCRQSAKEMVSHKPPIKARIPVFYQNKLLKLLSVRRSRQM
ncbi:unnamed protein product [Arctia plantaginis]|uniref:Uncharacterized protein n=1 Tax=Arctia plantaginis TaxID=874455 RepID=A0A8S0YM16_ARCPL|nr:unnamed protein product [Arctia plantaginis]